METLETSLMLPDIWQQEAMRALNSGADVVVDAPTGAGKTYIFELLAENAAIFPAVYTVPTRALANDKLLEWRKKSWNVGITTGDVTDNLEAPIIVATLETQKHLLQDGIGPALMVIDEYQMIADTNRGVNYELALALTPPETRLLLLSGSVGNPQEVAQWLEKLGRRCVLIRHLERPVPLEEVHVENLPDTLPGSFRGFWPRAIGRALKEGVGPILAFAPRRRAAENLARQLARMLPEEDPLVLTEAQTRLAGESLARLLRARIAFHHSGLSYRQRAGLVEPLAKAGQLRVVVATMGLSSGINFSLRSVLVTDREYRHGDRHHLVRPDELLQMFGRAGRRGLDKRGYILVAPGKPRLNEARPLQLKRSNQVDWPSLLRLMARAEQEGTSPLQAARDLAARLFSRQRVPLGLDQLALYAGPKNGAHKDSLLPEAARTGVQQQIEILNSAGLWERRRAPRKMPLGHCLIATPEGWRPALSQAEILATVGTGRLIRLRRDTTETPEDAPANYGREIPLARWGRDEKEGELVLTKWMYARLREYLEDPCLPRRKWTREKVQTSVLPLLPILTEGGRACQVRRAADMLYVQLDYAAHEVFAHVDSLGKALLDPPTRERSVAYAMEGPSADSSSAGGSEEEPPALAWLRLGLIDAHGKPTLRGRLFSFFNHGEGLAVAAALENPDYPVEELVMDLANLRAGHRFNDFDAYAGRLGRACRETFRNLTYPGYLYKGLPQDYGDGAAEILADLKAGTLDLRQLSEYEISEGDVERARLEWRSLLNHLAHAPDLGWDRWLALKTAALEQLQTLGPPPQPGDFPPLTHLQRQRHKSFLRFE
jgi:hypothetical protein